MPSINASSVPAAQSLAAARNCNRHLVYALRRAVDPTTAPSTYADLMNFAMRYRNLRGEHLRALRTMTGRRNSAFALGQTRVGLGTVAITHNRTA